MHAKRRSRLAASVGSVLLTLAAIGGVVCILAVVAATFFQVSLVMFATGSMSPTIPAGSVAVVRQVPADQVRVGDVVTVDRPGELPITHRIVAIGRPGSVPGANGVVSLTLRGDANRTNDQAPYLVSHVRLVLGSVPGAAPVIVFVSNPVVLGVVTVAAALLVGWAFWPRAQDGQVGDGQDDDGQDDEQDGDPQDDAHGPASAARHRAASGVGTAAIVILLAAGAAATAAPAPARADTTETVVSGRYITLTSIADADAFAALTPGNPVRWIVGVSARPPDPAIIRLGLSASGVLAGPRGLLVSIAACGTSWVGARCPGGAVPLLAEQPVAAVLQGLPPDGVRELGTMPSSEERWLAVDVTLPSGWLPGSAAALRIHAWGAGDRVQTNGPPASLAGTGGDASVLPIALAAGAVLAGAATAGLARRRHRAGTR